MINNLVDNRQIRVFISSTFSYMENEREYLIRHIFPKLRNMASKHEVTLTEIDLRWGITKEEAQSGKVVELCLNEIDNCIPFFIGIVGHHYGWIPSKEDIHESENMKNQYKWVANDIESQLSVTEMEMQYGVIRREEKVNAYFYLRNTEPQEAEIDFPDKIDKLRKTILNNRRYPVTPYQTLEELGDAVERDFIQLLNELFPTEQTTTFENERRVQNANIRQLCQCYIANNNYIKFLDEFLYSTEAQYLTVAGPSGIGKSSLLANWIKEKETTDDLRYWLYYFTSGQDDVSPENVLRYWINDLHRLQEIETSDLSSITGLEQLKSLLENCIQNSKRQVVIILDDASIFKQSDNWKINTLSWIPRMNFKSKLIVSTCVSDEKSKEHYPEKDDAEEKTLLMHPLSKKDIKSITRKYLKELYGKKLTDEQVLHIANKEMMNNCRILITLLDTLVYHGNFESLENHLKSFLTSWTPNNFYERYLSLWEQELGAELVENVLMLIAVSTYGLKETEIRDCLDIKPITWSQFYCIFANHFVSQKGCLRFTNTDVQNGIMHRYRKYENNHRNSLIQYLEESLTFAEGSQKERFWDELSTQYWAMKSRHEYEELMAEKLYMLISQREVFDYLYNKRASKMVAFNGTGKQIYRYWSWLYSFDRVKYSLLTYIEKGKYPETVFLSMACDIVDVAWHAGDLDTVVLTLHKARQLSKKGVTISDERLKILIGNLSLLSLVATEWGLETTSHLLDKEISESSFFEEETVLENMMVMYADARVSSNDSKALDSYYYILEILKQIYSEPDLDKAIIYYDICRTYYNLQDFEKALRYVDLSMQTVDFITDSYIDRNECIMAKLSGYKTRILKSAGQYEEALESCNLTIERYSYIEDLREEHGDYTIANEEYDYWSEEYNEIKEIMDRKNGNNQIDSSEQLEANEESDKELTFLKDHDLRMTKAKEGDPIAQHSLGEHYRVEGNYPKAIEWFQKSAAQNNAQAQYDLAQLYLDCEEVEQDLDLAFSWLQKSADLGNLSAFMDLGCMYQYGLGVEENLSKAIESFLIPANKGDKQAYYELARLYHETNNNKEALIWSKKAVQRSPFDPDGIAMQASILQALGKYEEALKQFEYCLKLYKKLVDKEEEIQETEEKIAALKILLDSNATS